MASLTVPTVEQIRAKFPSLSNSEVFMDNAGGSQVPGSVVDAVREYMQSSYVQVGADYPASTRATETVDEAHTMVNTIFGGEHVGHAILGPSSSVLCRMLADCYADVLTPGDEIIVGESGHEANIGPWTNLQKRGFNVKIWRANPDSGSCDLEGLTQLLTERTKLVAFVHVSNLLGHAEDIRPLVEAAHAVGARVIVDGVAYAPHLAMDVAAWNVDWYVYSCYKVFGPHICALFGTSEAIDELTGPNHYFLPKNYLPGKFELGGPNHESCAGLLGLKPYLGFLADSNSFSRSTVTTAWDVMEQLERPLTARFLNFLRSKPTVRVIGKAVAESTRLPTISFLSSRVQTPDIALAAQSAGIGMRYGSFYSVRLCERLGLNTDTGVARASFAHYNTMSEVDRLIAALDPIL